MQALRKNEVQNVQKLVEHSIQDLRQQIAVMERREGSAEARIDVLEEQMQKEVIKWINKGVKRVEAGVEAMQKTLMEQMDGKIQALQSELIKVGKGQETELKQSLVQARESFESKHAELKKDMGCQLHEICSMVEELAGMNKRLEFQCNQQRQSIDASSNGIATLQRRIEELTRENKDEFSVIKSRQNELTELYSTYIDSEDQLFAQ